MAIAVLYTLIVLVALVVLTTAAVLIILCKFSPAGITKLELNLPWLFSIKTEFEPGTRIDGKE